MTSDIVRSAMAFKLALEIEFLQVSGLKGREDFSATYSCPQRSPLLWLNANPGGDAESAVIIRDAEIASGKHEFFEGHGKTSQHTGRYLREAFPQQPLMRLKSAQGSNIIWHRSNELKTLRLPSSVAAEMAKPLIEKLIRYVEPQMIVMGGKAFELFEEVYHPITERIGERLNVPCGGVAGREEARGFERFKITVKGLFEGEAIAILHPCFYRFAISQRIQSTIGTINLPIAIPFLAST
jgi:hypothetical protein